MSGIPPPPFSLPGIGGGPPPPPPPPPGSILNSYQVASPLPLINIPKPRSKMKTLQWQKIPVTSVIGKPNIWTIIGRLENKIEMDYEKMEELFSLTHDSGPKRSSSDIDGVPDPKKKKENTEINILDGKRSLNVNIFLKQFRMDHEEIVQMLREGRCEKFGAERLRSLLKLLPSQEEIDAINGFSGDIDKLGNAEKFFICIMKLPNYRMRVEGLLIMEEFNVNMEWIRPSVESVIQAAKDIQDSQSLRELIRLILISGNYLNSGNYAGNAAGFKLSSLLKLTEIRANKPGMNLLHYVAQEAEEKNPTLLKFPDEMRFLKDAAQVSVETLTTDINNIASKVRAITEQIVVAGIDFQQQMAFFLKEANVEVNELEEDLNDIEEIKLELATFFCEDIKIFKLEECFKILQTFCERLKKATEENMHRRIQEAKTELRRKSKELKALPNSNPTEPGDHSKEEDSGSIVNMLLDDVRNRFTTRKFSEGSFYVTKVRKVNLSSAGNSPTRGSSPTLDSLIEVRNRRSHASDDDDSLIDFFMETIDSTADSTKPKSQFERYASLRRRRLERKEKQSALKVTELDRERTPSPSNSINLSMHTNHSVSDVQMRHNNNGVSPDKTHIIPQSEIYSTSNDNHSLHQSKNWTDKPSLDKTRVEQRKKELKNETDESDALIMRIKQRLSKMDGRNTPPISEEGDQMTNLQSSHQDTTSVTKKSSRWRSSIPVSESCLPLETITEKNLSLDNFALSSHTKNIDKPHERRSDRFRSSPNPAELSRTFENIDNSTGPKHSQDDHKVTVSMRKKISSGMGTDIDGVLKTIEDTGRQIDTVGVTGPIKRNPEQSTNRTQAQRPVAVVTHVTASNIPSTPILEQDLKTKRDKRKKRSTLSVDDVKAAMKLTDSVKGKDSVINRNDSFKSMHSNKNTNSTSISKTPPTQRRLRSNSDKIDGEKTSTNEDGNNNKDSDKAAKLAARKKFRGARFGFSGSSDVNSSGRARSNVESDSVDQALKEIACQSNMSRSKSYDEHVAKKALAGEGDFASNGIMRMNSGSAPDTSSEKRAVMRNSIKRLSMDGRRNGLYVPSDDSDTDLKPEDIGTRRSSKSDSPKSFSQLSLKSVNTSTETLPADVEPASDQNTKNLDHLSHNDIQNHNSVINNVQSNTSYPSDSSSLFNDSSSFHRSYSLMARHNDVEDESDSPLAAVAKWKMRRVKQRMSTYDNINENVSPDFAISSIHNHQHYLKSEENDSRNEVESRNSYASSSDKDEGFETGSGSMSQRTSMSSNFEAEMYNTPTLSRRAESHKSKDTLDNLSHNKSVIKAAQENDSVISRLSQEVNRKERTENWTELTVRVNGEPMSDINNEFCNSLSSDSAHDTSKEDMWSDNISIPSSKSSKSISTSTQKVHSNSAKKLPVADGVANYSKPKSVPSYMLPTSSSSNKPVGNKSLSTAKTDTVAQTTSVTRDTPNRTSVMLPAVARIDTAFTRGTPNRTSVRNQEQTTVFKRDTVRASMRAETATAAFQRGTVARTSVRGPRSSISPTKSLLSPPGRDRSDSIASISSTTSALSNISGTPSTVSETAKRRLTPTSNIHGSSSPSTRSTTPSIHHPVSTRKSTISPIGSHTKTSTVSTNGEFTRTQSMRSTSGQTSLGSPTKHSTPRSVSVADGRRSVTPLIDKDPRITPVLPERPKSTTPFSHKSTISSITAIMPTSHTKTSTVSTNGEFTRTQSMRSTSGQTSLCSSTKQSTPLSVSIADGRRSVTPMIDKDPRITPVLPERPKSTTPFSSENKSSKRSSFMAPTASSRAKTDEQAPVAPPRTKSLHSTTDSSFNRSASLRMPKNDSGRVSPATTGLPFHTKSDHNQSSLSTVTEQVDEDKEAISKKTSSVFKRISVSKSKTSPEGTKSLMKLSISASVKK